MERDTAPIVVMRQPSTANLMLDSADRNEALYPSPNAFSITKQNSILNGFFTRIGTTEVVLEWFTPNISPDLSNNVIVIDISGTTSGAVTQPVALNGFYTNADLYNVLVVALNSAAAGSITPAPTFSISTAFGGVRLVSTANVYVSFSGPLATLLQLPATLTQLNPAIPPAIIPTSIVLRASDLRPVRYLDFISSQLTYNQDLKDSSTAASARDVLCRWYFSFDNPPTQDEYGFPILMGYKSFCLRRIFSPPKQIKWWNRQPIGNLSFEVYDDTGVLAKMSSPNPQTKTNWLMTLQVSEN